MAAAVSDLNKVLEEKSNVNNCSAATSHLIEHTLSRDTDTNDVGASAIYHSVPTSKSDIKTGDYVGVVSVLAYDTIQDAILTCARKPT